MATTTAPPVHDPAPPAPRRFHGIEAARFISDRRLRADPYPLYAWLRSHERVHHSILGATLVSGYDEALALLRDPCLSNDESNADLSYAAGRRGAGWWHEAPARAIIHLADFTGPGGDLRPFREMSLRFLLLKDPPDHTRLRSLVARAFTPRTVEAFRPRIEQIAAELLEALAPAGGAELLSAYAYRLPVIVICELVGIPVEDHSRFGAWVPALVDGVDPMAVISRRVRDRADEAALALDEYLRGLIDARRREPRDDLLSALIAASDGDDRLSTDELVVFVALLLVAGHETTANLIGNGLWDLWRHPDQYARWRAEPDVRPSGVEELLRHDTPIQMVQRITTADVEVGGTTIPAGRFVMILLGAANRDPHRFTDPDRLDLGRDEGPSTAFGFGLHHCLGANLARAEAVVALGTLVDRFPRLRVELPAPRWRDTFVFRGLRELPVRW